MLDANLDAGYWMLDKNAGVVGAADASLDAGYSILDKSADVTVVCSLWSSARPKWVFDALRPILI
ncbi:MAG: hypothetical protein QF437_01380 [Planctomycetota bacterium]|jgi:hypothetical protein|nr:hypothetical protein [Planctomycetota bacterium]|tara:strand:+ start:480 stop:674 length:195 start_codon:yes stop_codon:yes gene_type:complete